MQKDVAIISSKFDVNRCSHGQHKTDRQTAFQLYIVDTVANMLHCIEYKPSCASTYTPSFHVIKLIVIEAPSEEHSF